jgi:hypothetical protein
MGFPVLPTSTTLRQAQGRLQGATMAQAQARQAGTGTAQVSAWRRRWQRLWRQWRELVDGTVQTKATAANQSAVCAEKKRPLGLWPDCVPDFLDIKEFLTPPSPRFHLPVLQ